MKGRTAWPVFALCVLVAAVAVSVQLSHVASGSSSGSSGSLATVTTNGAGQPVYSYTMPPSASPTSCWLALDGHDAIIGFRSSSVDVEPACQTFISSHASEGELWQLMMTGGPTSQTIVCQLQDASGQAFATVYDDGGQDYGQEACENLLAGTWTESTGSTGSSGQ